MTKNIEEYYAKVNLVFSETYEKIVFYAKDKMHSADNIIDFLIEAMRLVAKHEELHGFQKKELVLDVVRKIIETMDISEEDKDRLRNNVAPHLGGIVDFIVAAGKGYLFLKHVKEEIEEEFDECVAKCNGCVPRRNRGCKKQKKEVNHKALASKLDCGAITNLVYDKLKSMVTTKQITATNIMGAAILTMQLVEEYPTLEGSEKKQIVKDVVYKLVADAPISDDAKFGIKMFLDSTLDKTIDFTVGVANGQIDILGKIQEAIDHCVAVCC